MGKKTRCPHWSSSEGMFAPEQATPARSQTPAAPATCISSPSLEGLQQVTSPPTHFERRRNNEGHEVIDISSIALSPIHMRASAGRHTDDSPGSRRSRYWSNSRRSTPITSASSHSSEESLDDSERFPFARRLNFEEGMEEQEDGGEPPRSLTDMQEDDEDEDDPSTLFSLDLSAQSPPPDLSSSVISDWRHVYDKQAAEREACEAANEVIDELDKSFTPTVEKYAAELEKCDKDKPNNASDATTRVPEPEWMQESWFRRGSSEGVRRGMRRGGYDSRHTHVGFGSSI